MNTSALGQVIRLAAGMRGDELADKLNQTSPADLQTILSEADQHSQALQTAGLRLKRWINFSGQVASVDERAIELLLDRGADPSDSPYALNLAHMP